VVMSIVDGEQPMIPHGDVVSAFCVGFESRREGEGKETIRDSETTRDSEGGTTECPAHSGKEDGSDEKEHSV